MRTEEWLIEAGDRGDSQRHAGRYRNQKGCRRGQRQARIMIAKEMAMTIRGTSHSAMVRTPADRLQRRHDYMEKARACRAIIEKLCPQYLRTVCIKLLTAAENDPALADLPFHPGAV